MTLKVVAQLCHVQHWRIKDSQPGHLQKVVAAHDYVENDCAASMQITLHGTFSIGKSKPWSQVHKAISA